VRVKADKGQQLDDQVKAENFPAEETAFELPEAFARLLRHQLVLQIIERDRGGGPMARPPARSISR
jgi:hypothetical protein